MHAIRVFIVICWIVIRSATGLAAEPTNIEAAIDGLITSHMEGRRVPAVSVAVINKGKIEFLKTYGYSSLEPSVPATIDTVYQVASNTKAFTAVAIQVLAETGKLSLNDKLGRYLADIPASWKAVTIRQLLQHTSGIPNLSVDQYTLETLAATWEDAIDLLGDKPLEFEPGSQWQYNSTNMLLLDKLIETVSGLPYVRFMAEHLFNPLNISSATFGGINKKVPNRAIHYTWFDFSGEHPKRAAQRQMLDFAVDPVGYAGGGLNISLRDFALWLAALQKGELIKPESLTELWQPTKLIDGTIYQAPDGAPYTHYGLCWIINNEGKQSWVGGTGGLRSAFAVYPNQDLGIIVLTNLQGAAPEQIVEGIGEILFDN